MSAAALKERLRADLKTAMQARANGELRVLRTLIAGLDNAEAVAVEGKPDPFRKLGDPSGEVARRELDGAAVEELLVAEIEARRTAAGEYRRGGREAEADALLAEIALVERYL